MKNNEVASGGLVSLDATKEINETSSAREVAPSLWIDSRNTISFTLFFFFSLHIIGEYIYLPVFSFFVCFGPSLTSAERVASQVD